MCDSDPRPPLEVPWDYSRGPSITEMAARGAQLPAHMRPHTEIQALMEAAPGDQPEVSLQELAALGDVLADAVATLSHPLRYVFEGTMIERRPVRSFTFGEVFGPGHRKADSKISHRHVIRLRDRALSQLRSSLSNNPTITRHLRGDDTQPD